MNDLNTEFDNAVKQWQEMGRRIVDLERELWEQKRQAGLTRRVSVTWDAWRKGIYASKQAWRRLPDIVVDLAVLECESASGCYCKDCGIRSDGGLYRIATLDKAVEVILCSFCRDEPGKMEDHLEYLEEKERKRRRLRSDKALMVDVDPDDFEPEILAAMLGKTCQ